MKRLFVFFTLVLLSPAAAFAITTEQTGVIETGTAIYGEDQSQIELGAYIGDKIIEPFFGILGIIFLILMIYGGLLWMTGGGSAETVKKARGVLTAAIIGLLVILLSYGFTLYIFERVT